jgi:hypothetical protein
MGGLIAIFILYILYTLLLLFLYCIYWANFIIFLAFVTWDRLVVYKFTLCGPPQEGREKSIKIKKNPVREHLH